MRVAGVRFLAGTDLGVRDIYPGSSLHDELEWLVKIGFSPLEALRAATVNPAAVTGRASTSGSVNIGKVADLVVLDANPLDDIANVRRIHGVVLAGRFIDRKELDALLEQARTAARQQ